MKKGRGLLEARPFPSDERRFRLSLEPPTERSPVVVVQDGVFLIGVQAEGVIIIFDDLGLLFDEVCAVVVEPYYVRRSGPWL